MIFDVVVSIIVLLSFFSGYKKGLIYMVFTVVGISLGVIASLQLSYITANYLYKYFTIQEQWLPMLSFLASFLFVFIVVSAISSAIERVLKFIRLNFINKLMGGVLGAVLSFSVISIAVWYALGFKVLLQNVGENSLLLHKCALFGSYIITTLGEWFPFLKQLFYNLQQLFVNFAVDNLNAN